MMTITKHDPNAKWWLKSVPYVNNWSDINVLRFLRYYQSHPVLWNVHATQYKNVCARRRAYHHIVELLNLTGVDIEECMRLVEWLKKKYVEEKGVRRSKCERRPAWFEIIRGIVKRILNPEDGEWDFECCKECCDCETPSSTTVSSDFQACKDCCADQNLHPPCEYYKTSDKSDDDEDSNPCHLEKVECYTICNDEMKVVLFNIGDGLKKYNSDCDCKTDSSENRNSDCDCKTENGSSKKSSSICTCCKSASLPSLPKSESSCDCQKSSTCTTTDSIPSVSTVAKFCIQPMPSESSSNTSSSSKSTKIVDEKIAGIFMASRRFCGKRISLVDDYMYNDCGELEVVPPKLHFARCCCGSDYYPLQVEL